MSSSSDESVSVANSESPWDNSSDYSDASSESSLDNSSDHADERVNVIAYVERALMSGESSNDDDDDDDNDENNDDDQFDPAMLAEQIKNNWALYHRDVQNKREFYLEVLFQSIGAHKDRPFPQLRQIYTAKELDQLLLDAVEHNGCSRVWRRIVPLVARSGHKHVAELDDAGKPLLRRATVVHRAAQRSLKEIMPHLFEIYDGSYDANYVDEAGVTHFHLACKYGHYEACAGFIASANNKVDVNAPTGAGDRPLHLALSSPNDDPRLIELLLRAGADPNLADPRDGSTALHLVCRKYSHASARRLYELSESRGRPMLVDAADALGHTPLHATLLQGGERMDTVEFLLRRAGANPNLANPRDGSTALHLLCGQGRRCDAFLARLLFQASRGEFLPLRLDAPDKELGDTPLHRAVRRGNRVMVQLMLEQGAHPHLANRRGFTPLHLICTREALNGERRIATWAVAAAFHRGCVGRARGGGGGGRLFDFVDEPDADGNTPLHLAVSKKRIDIMDFLLEHGADPNARNELGSTVLHMICEMNHFSYSDWATSFFKKCRRLGRRVRVDIRDPWGRTPLERAVASLQPKAIGELFYNGADLSGFVFPSLRDFDRDRTENADCTPFYKMKLAAGALVCAERLARRGYQLVMSDVLTIMRIFARYNLFEISTENIKDLRDNVQFRDLSKLMKFKPDLTLYDLIRLRPEEAAKRLTYKNYYKFKSRPVKLRDIPPSYRSACGAHLAEKLSRKFFLGWGLDCFMQLTHHRLPILCCEMIIRHLNNKDLFLICLVTAIKATKNLKWQMENVVECNDEERPVETTNDSRWQMDVIKRNNRKRRAKANEQSGTADR
ncbi:uncharacterized protein LOC106659914 [Trichogramma pretiosum]|uniref:uncharacterized protein LOC106659914 n=1 Tax=Trichogramma pretiosum TaxID=7493 RepID=UPI0006C98884|nr:uncharacterized protein LOC106659914 [Trichogramma pretiosum]